MSEALKSLNNIRTLRAQGRELSLEVLEEILEKLNVIVDERRQEESSKAAELQARQEKLDTLRKLMEEDGINPEELLGSFQAKSTATKKSREPRPAKYSFTDEATVVEASGEPVFLIEGEYENIKITRPADLLVAERILAERSTLQ